jgi:LysM repeat protein
MSTTIENWIASAVGRNMNPDGAFGNQCVDLVDQYGQDIFGVPWPKSVGGVNGAKGLLDAAPDAYWIRINNDLTKPNQIPMRGDVIVWGGDASNVYGHTAVVESADTTFVHVIQENGNFNWLPAGRATLRYSQHGTGTVTGWLRPRPEKVLAPPAPPAARKPTQCIVTKGDTLSTIAKQFGTSVNTLIALNKGRYTSLASNPNVIEPGWVFNLV